MTLDNTTGNQDRSLSTLADAVGIEDTIAQVLDVAMSRDSQLTKALKTFEDLRDEIKDLEAQLYEARNGGDE